MTAAPPLTISDFFAPGLYEVMEKNTYLYSWPDERVPPSVQIVQPWAQEIPKGAILWFLEIEVIDAHKDLNPGDNPSIHYKVLYEEKIMQAYCGLRAMQSMYKKIKETPGVSIPVIPLVSL